MAVTAELAAEIAGKRPDIGALAAFHFEMRAIRIRAGEQGQPEDIDFTRGDFDGFAFTRQIIGAFTRYLDGGKLRRHLADGADVAGQDIADLLFAGTVVRACGHLAFEIVRCPLFAPADREFIDLAAVHHIGNGLRRIAERDRQHGTPQGQPRS